MLATALRREHNAADASLAGTASTAAWATSGLADWGQMPSGTSGASCASRATRVGAVEVPLPRELQDVAPREVVPRHDARVVQRLIAQASTAAWAASTAVVGSRRVSMAAARFVAPRPTGEQRSSRRRGCCSSGSRCCRRGARECAYTVHLDQCAYTAHLEEPRGAWPRAPPRGRRGRAPRPRVPRSTRRGRRRRRSAPP